MRDQGIAFNRDCDNVGALVKRLSKKPLKSTLWFGEVTVMNGSSVVGPPERARILNAVPLQSAVLCAECDVVSDSPHDTCLVCGSHSLFNVARVFGGRLPKKRTSLIAQQPVEASSCDVKLVLPTLHRVRRRGTIGQRQLPVLALDDTKNELEREMLVQPKGR